MCMLHNIHSLVKKYTAPDTVAYVALLCSALLPGVIVFILFTVLL